ncbi:MAG TPA: ABC transporter permease [Holophaga sp.]|nr:ABC transporter permease [Holophaga sp.]
MNETRLAALRILAQAYHISLNLRRDAFRLLDVTLWPLVLFLSMGLFCQAFSPDPRAMGLVVLGCLGWRVIYHFQMEAVQIYMDNYWMGMIEHVMISPVRWWEFILGGAVSALGKILVIAALFLGLGRALFGVRVEAPWTVLAALLACAACGLVLAVFSMGVAFLKRGDAFAFIFAFPDAIAVLSGVFYPVTVFPGPVQALAALLPTTHAFGLLKATLGLGRPEPLLFLATLVPWLAGGVLFTSWALGRARRLGKLVKMR